MRSEYWEWMGMERYIVKILNYLMDFFLEEMMDLFCVKWFMSEKGSDVRLFMELWLIYGWVFKFNLYSVEFKGDFKLSSKVDRRVKF